MCTEIEHDHMTYMITLRYFNGDFKLLFKLGNIDLQNPDKIEKRLT